MPGRAYILCRFARESSLYNTWLSRLPVPYEVIDGPLVDWQAPADAEILITHMHYRWDEYQVLRRLYVEDRIPVLILADGVLEFRNLYEHPDLADGCIFQPVVGHKLACLGRSQARQVESWGNVGKCEVVGLPRLDGWLDGTVPPIRSDGPFRLLIATASTPAFNSAQRRTVIESLGEIKRGLEAQPQVGGRPIEVTWRLTDGIDFELNVAPAKEEAPAVPLSQAIDQADAVMTTPSTLYLESALKGRPTALLDFHQVPPFVVSAWTISNAQQARHVVEELCRPPAAKMLFQSTALHDQLHCHTPATERLLQVIGEMIEAGRQARRAGTHLLLPARILDDPDHGLARVDRFFDLAQLFPDNAAFRHQELAALQVELNLAIERIKDRNERLKNLEAELAYVRKRLAKGSEQYRVLKDRLMRARGRLKNFREQVANLMKRLAAAQQSGIAAPEDLQQP